jgi:cysteinyl-tRNA synthetase
MLKEPDWNQLADLVKTFTELTGILGLRFVIPALTAEDKAMLSQYNEARAKKDFAASDKLRPILAEKGLI